MKPLQSRLSISLGSSLLMILALAAPQSKKAPTNASIDGKTLFTKKCAPCHGPGGQGGAGYSNPLAGDLTIEELSKYIATSMPPGAKKTPVSEAKLVAGFIHNEFYSPLAQERNRPARLTLSRLTVKQFKNAVADLINTNEWNPVVSGNAGGLKAQIYKTREKKKENLLVERTDTEVNFDFGTSGPAPEKMDGKEYSIIWSGSVVAPETGDYEFIAETDHAVKVFVNGWKTPLVDAWVKSGNDTEFKNTITLIGGRAYPIYIDFAKAQQGVNIDPTKKKPELKPAFFRLKWRRPKGAPEVIPSQYLYQSGMGTTYVVATKFPADDRSIGYERGNSVTKSWDDSVTTAVLEAADFIDKNIFNLSQTTEQASDKVEKIKSFCKNFVTRAFRQPLTPDLEEKYVNKHFANGVDISLSVRKVVILALKSPRFLYHTPEDRSPYSIASELALSLWDTIPDGELRGAAGNGTLATEEGIRRQAERMANHPRAWAKFRDFLMLWLKIDEIPDINKSKSVFPEFNEQTVNDLRTSLDLFLQTSAGSPNGTFKDLMLSNKMFLNGRLAKVYGAPIPEQSGFQEVTIPDRSGVLTQPYLLARLAYLEGTSPIHRGVLIARSMLGRTLAPPPQAFTPLAASLHPGMSTRERVAMQTKPDPCNSCHNMINPLGFTLEKYDAIGRARTEECGKAIDTTGDYQTKQGETIRFSDVAQLAKFITNSDESQTAFVEKLFQYMHKQPIRAFGTYTSAKLAQEFRSKQLRFRDLIISIATTPPQHPKVSPAISNK